jgi:hypothetical protein
MLNVVVEPPMRPDASINAETGLGDRESLRRDINQLALRPA